MSSDEQQIPQTQTFQYIKYDKNDHRYPYYQDPTTVRNRKFVEIHRKLQQHKNNILQIKFERKAHYIKQQIQEEKEHNNSVVFVFCFKKSQKYDLIDFISVLQPQLKTLQCDEDNAYIIRFIDQEDIREIILKMFIMNEQQKNAIIIFVVKRITMFNTKDIELLHRSIEKRLFYLIIPTFNDLTMSENVSTIGQYQIIQFYNQKELFCQFMINALADSQICCYFPNEILHLVTDYDYYPLSFSQGVRRYTQIVGYIYSRGIQFKYVKILELIEIIQKVLNSFSINDRNVKIEEKILKTIFSHDFIFKIPSNLFQKIDDNLLLEVAEKLSKRFQKVAYLEKYSKQIGNLQDQKYQIKKSKDSRVSQLKIPRLVKTKQDMLEQQLTSIIRDVTKDINIQGNKIKWESLKFNQRIKPQIPLQIFKDLNKDPNLRQLLKKTTQSIQKQHNEILNEGKLDQKQYFYHMSNLQFHGVIQNSKKQIAPTFYNQLFRKVKFQILNNNS